MIKRKNGEQVKPKHALQEAIGFTLEDLEWNDGGLLSQSQRQMLKRDFGLWFLSNLVIVAGYAIAYRGFQSGDKTYNDIGSLILLYLLALPFFLLTLNNWLRLLIDVIIGKVGTAEGYITLDVVSDRGGTRYKLLSEDVRFKLPKPVFLAFKNNEPYRIHFAPYSKTIVSAEWLRYSDD